MNGTRQRITKQQQILLDTIATCRTFFTAEELYERTQHKSRRIGIATIYRLLKHLTENGQLHSYQCDRKTIYSVDKRTHSHFTCEACGTVKHLAVQKVDFLKPLIKGNICHFQLDVTGVCEKCREMK